MSAAHELKPGDLVRQKESAALGVVVSVAPPTALVKFVEWVGLSCPRMVVNECALDGLVWWHTGEGVAMLINAEVEYEKVARRFGWSEEVNTPLWSWIEERLERAEARQREHEYLTSATSERSYEDLWPFWLDDACYRVARGARYLDIPSEVSKRVWVERILPRVSGYEQEHGVVIRAAGDEDGVEVQVARYRWVFDLLDLARVKGGQIEDAMTGVLLGYDADKIDGFFGVGKRELVEAPSTVVANEPLSPEDPWLASIQVLTKLPTAVEPGEIVAILPDRILWYFENGAWKMICGSDGQPRQLPVRKRFYPADRREQCASCRFDGEVNCQPAECGADHSLWRPKGESKGRMR